MAKSHIIILVWCFFAISVAMDLKCHTCIDPWSGSPEHQELLFPERFKPWSGSVTEHCNDPTVVDYIPSRPCPNACFSVYFYPSLESSHTAEIKNLVARGCWADFFPDKDPPPGCTNASTTVKFKNEVSLIAEFCACNEQKGDEYCNQYKRDENPRVVEDGEGGAKIAMAGFGGFSGKGHTFTPNLLLFVLSIFVLFSFVSL